MRRDDLGRISEALQMKEKESWGKEIRSESFPVVYI